MSSQRPRLAVKLHFVTLGFYLNPYTPVEAPTWTIAINYLLEQNETPRRPPTRLRFEDLKKVTTFWAAATLILLEMTVDAIAAIILVPAAACGGLHAGEWPGLVHFVLR